jgi:ribonuclease P protein component
VERLKRRSEFLRVAGARRKWATPGLVLQARRRPENGGATRIGFTASRKVGGAVERNRARRRLKAAAAEIVPAHAKAGYDLVLIARGATAKRPWSALLEDLETALKRVGAWRGDNGNADASAADGKRN